MQKEKCIKSVPPSKAFTVSREWREKKWALGGKVSEEVFSYVRRFIINFFLEENHKSKLKKPKKKKWPKSKPRAYSRTSKPSSPISFKWYQFLNLLIFILIFLNFVIVLLIHCTFVMTHQFCSMNFTSLCLILVFLLMNLSII